MQEQVHSEETERVLLLLKREIQRAASRLIKVRPRDALRFANRQAEYMGENGRQEDQVYWEKIAAEVEKQSRF
ncbi:MAG: hypothetical protein ISR51_05860 [Rhodospirillales bacterium]|nr:hypothetical protein [Alphaproteobacteria bacterium]MBL6948183.1 hypothetical protein [Rhodospirillales bacterium]